MPGQDISAEQFAETYKSIEKPDDRNRFVISSIILRPDKEKFIQDVQSQLKEFKNHNENFEKDLRKNAQMLSIEKIMSIPVKQNVVGPLPNKPIDRGSNMIVEK